MFRKFTFECVVSVLNNCRRVSHVSSFVDLIKNFQCVKWHGDNTESLIFVVNLKTGETTNGIKTEAIYSTHHINAYEVCISIIIYYYIYHILSYQSYQCLRGHWERTGNCGRRSGHSPLVNSNSVPFLNIDTIGAFCRYALTNFTDKEAMLNAEDTGSMENLFEIRRYQIDIENEQVRLIYIQTCQLRYICFFKAFSSSWENNAAEAQPYYNQFDFPKVNPNYYGRYPTILQSIIPNVQSYIQSSNQSCQTSTPTTTEGIQPFCNPSFQRSKHPTINQYIIPNDNPNYYGRYPIITAAVAEDHHLFSLSWVVMLCIYSSCYAMHQLLL